MKSSLLVSSAVALDVHCDRKWGEFSMMHPKLYSSADAGYRKAIFCKNLEMIATLQKNDQGATYSHLSPFAASSPEEMQALRGLSKPNKPILFSSHRVPLSMEDIPDSLDWTEHEGVVAPVKNQKQCGSCWAFGVINNVESGFVVQTGGPLQILSEQQLVSCDNTGHGCQGGWPAASLENLSTNRISIELGKDYPYTARDGDCKYDARLGKITISGYQQIGQETSEIKKALNKFGPLSVAVDATHFGTYHNGVMDGSNCDPQTINHAVNIVGYGKVNGAEYFKGRNSWSANWGEKGYFRVAVGECNINNYVVTATFDKMTTAPTTVQPTTTDPCEDN